MSQMYLWNLSIICYRSMCIIPYYIDSYNSLLNKSAVLYNSYFFSDDRGTKNWIETSSKKHTIWQLSTPIHSESTHISCLPIFSYMLCVPRKLTILCTHYLRPSNWWLPGCPFVVKRGLATSSSAPQSSASRLSWILGSKKSKRLIEHATISTEDGTDWKPHGHNLLNWLVVSTRTYSHGISLVNWRSLNVP